MFNLNKLFYIAIGIFVGFQMGIKDKEAELAGETPCVIDVDGQQKRVPQSVCTLMEQARKITGSNTGNPYA